MLKAFTGSRKNNGTKLDMRGMSIESDLKNLLTNNHNQRTGCNLTPIGLIALGEELRINPSVTELDLFGGFYIAFLVYCIVNIMTWQVIC